MYFIHNFINTNRTNINVVHVVLKACAYYKLKLVQGNFLNLRFKME